jgi:hypothetical protein
VESCCDFTKDIIVEICHEHTSDFQTRGLVRGLNQRFHGSIKISKVRMEEHEEIETAIKEEVFLMFLRTKSKYGSREHREN